MRPSLSFAVVIALSVLSGCRSAPSDDHGTERRKEQANKDRNEHRKERGERQKGEKGRERGAAPVVAGEDQNGKQVVLAKGQFLMIKLPSNPSTGYSWRVEQGPDAAVLRALADKYMADPVRPGEGMIVGRGGHHAWKFAAAGAGSTAIRLSHVSPGGEVATTFSIDVVVK